MKTVCCKCTCATGKKDNVSRFITGETQQLNNLTTSAKRKKTKICETENPKRQRKKTSKTEKCEKILLKKVHHRKFRLKSPISK